MPFRSRAVLLAGCALAAAGCPPPPDEPERGGTLVVALAGDVDSWNPYATQDPVDAALLDLLYPRLVRETAGGFEPWLASSWEASGDGLAISFHLRPDATWSNGMPVTCEDVRFTREAQLSDAVDWPGAGPKRRVRAIDCPDPHTAVFRFSRRYAEQLADAGDGPIVPKEYGYVPLEEWRNTAWERRSITCGPFRLAAAAIGKDTVLRRDPSFWGAEEVHLDRIVFRVAADADTGLTRFLDGEIDVYPDVPPLRDGEVRNRAGFALYEVPSLSTTYLAWNVLEPGAYLADRRRRSCDVGGECAEGPQDILRLRKEHPHPILSDSRVRRALSLATDRQALVDRMWGGHAAVGASPIVSALWAYEPASLLPHDEEAARMLLAEAGWRDGDGDGVLDRDGVRFELRVLLNESDPVRRAALDRVAAGLARLGVRLLAQPVPRGELASRARFKDFDAILAGSLAGRRIEPQSILHTRAAVHRGRNITAWSTPESDALLDQAAEALTRDDAEPLWSRWQMIFRVEQPYTILYEEKSLVGLGPRVRGADTTAPHPFPALWKMWVVKGGPAGSR